MTPEGDATCDGPAARLAISAAALLLCGCSSTLSPGPERLYSVGDEVKALQRQLSMPDPGQPYSREARNTYVTGRMYAMDFQYSQYFADLTKERQLGTLSADLAAIGLGAATAVVPGASTKAVLGAATTAVTGAQAAIDKDVLIQNTIQILQDQMEVDRLAIRSRITGNLVKTPQDYTVYQALTDLEDYYRAGTLAGALASLSASVGNNAQQGKDIQNGVSQAGQAITPRGRGITAVGGPVRAFTGPRQ